MVRGCEKRMIRLKKPDNRFFEEVYFVLRDELPDTGACERDIVAEANRILEEEGTPARRLRHRRRDKILWFAAGCAAGVLILFPFLLF